jgi:hypothetical protein
MNSLTFKVRQPYIQASVVDGQPFVVEAEQVPEGCLEVVDVDGVFDRCPPDFVGCSVDRASFGTSTGHPHAEGVRLVVAAVGSLSQRSSSEFTAPDDQRVIEHASLDKVSNKDIALASIATRHERGREALVLSSRISRSVGAARSLKFDFT